VTVLFPLLALTALGAPGCAVDRHAVRDPASERSDLVERAGQYWDGVRWSDVEGPMACIETVEQRAAWTLWYEGWREDFRVSEAAVVEARIDEAPPTDGRLAWGTVSVRVEGVDQATQRLELQRLEQRWYRTADGWYLDWLP
jgi:hypothetical protein